MKELILDAVFRVSNGRNVDAVVNHICARLVLVMDYDWVADNVKTDLTAFFKKDGTF
jgi:hypothetical protein